MATMNINNGNSKMNRLVLDFLRVDWVPLPGSPDFL